MSSDQELSNKISTIRRQTNYTEAEAHTQLQLCNMDHILVIKTFLGISSDKPKLVKPTSLNQETYRQIRLQLDSGVREFNQRVLKKEER
jgi:hypothetical protein